MKKLIKRIILGLAVMSAVSINSEKPTFAASQYYNMQEIEDSIYNHLENWDTSFPIYYYEKDVLDVIKEISKKDDYLNMSMIRLEYRGIGSKATVSVTYRTTIEQESYINNELQKAVNSIISPGMSDFQKVKAINKYLSDRFEYDYSYVSNNAYSALTTGKTTCQGYAMTTYKMLKLAGLENKIITGTLDDVGHGWNLVKVDGQWYHIDITNDDATSSNKYFLKSDDDLRKEGFEWKAEDYPKCDFNYDEASFKLKSNSYWYEQENSWYFMNSSGYNATEWNYIDGKWYYLGKDGKMRTGWIYDKGNWYYCWSNGSMASNTTIDGYELNKYGAWIG